MHWELLTAVQMMGSQQLMSPLVLLLIYVRQRAARHTLLQLNCYRSPA